MASYRIEFASNAAPIFSDHSHAYVEAETATEALRKGIAGYSHPAGLYAAVALGPKGKMLARFLSARAATMMDAPCGLLEWLDGVLHCSGKALPAKPDRWEEFAEPEPVAK